MQYHLKQTLNCNNASKPWPVSNSIFRMAWVTHSTQYFSLHGNGNLAEPGNTLADYWHLCLGSAYIQRMSLHSLLVHCGWAYNLFKGGQFVIWFRPNHWRHAMILWHWRDEKLNNSTQRPWSEKKTKSSWERVKLHHSVLWHIDNMKEEVKIPGFLL